MIHSHLALLRLLLCRLPGETKLLSPPKLIGKNHGDVGSLILYNVKNEPIFY